MRPRVSALALATALCSLAPAAAQAHRLRPSRRSVASHGVAPLTRDGRPNIQAQAAVIIDLGAGGGELYTKNADSVRPIASISKLMAVLVVMDRGLKLEG